MAERMAQVATSVSYATSGGATLLGTLTLNHVIALTGLFVALFTAGVNWYYRHKHYQLEISKAEAMKQSEQGENK